MPFTVNGHKETAAALAQLAKDLFDSDIPKVLQDAADTFVSKAQQNAPVDTGNLRDNIAVEEVDETHAVVTSGAEYSIYVEEGTSKMQAQPFMQPALAEMENEFHAMMTKAVTAAISQRFR
jgi:HK97 gp10 family phage protein